MAFLPKQLHRYFWDTDPKKLTQKNKKQIISRILEYGDEHAVQWMNEHFSKADIKECLQTTRSLSKKSANFWAFIFNIPKTKVLCLQKSFRQKHRKLWNY
mgnify:CR=1 FL=1